MVSQTIPRTYIMLVPVNDGLTRSTHCRPEETQSQGQFVQDEQGPAARDGNGGSYRREYNTGRDGGGGSNHIAPLKSDGRAFSTLSSFGPGMRRRSLLPSIQKTGAWNFGKTGASPGRCGHQTEPAAVALSYLANLARSSTLQHFRRLSWLAVLVQPRPRPTALYTVDLVQPSCTSTYSHP
jgi:hypothetical protein